MTAAAKQSEGEKKIEGSTAGAVPLPSKQERRRLAILKQADEMCIPAFMTPLWQATYGKPPFVRRAA